MDSLWGAEFSDSEQAKKKVAKIIKKAKEPKVIKDVSTEKLLKSKKVSVEDKIKAIEEEVNRILGQHKDNIVVIKDCMSLVKYFDAAIENGVISIDTETNNTLNTFDCKLIGPCLYTPGQKWAYIPVNHTDMEGNRLEWQVTEKQLKEQFKRLLDNQVFEVYHNATFDIEVIKTTCDIKLKADWDTMVGAQLLDENELKGLKSQYKLHIDPNHDKYDIEHLFKGLPYAIIDPDLFALYAATDAGMTYELYEWQKSEFRKPENKDVYKTFQEIEIPILDVVVDMELEGIEIDLEYADRLSKVYHNKLDEVQLRVDNELMRLKPIIDNWRQTKEANEPTISKQGKEGKSKSQQLSDPPELGSPTQMAILLYDVLKVPVVDKKTPRGTGADILEELAKSVPLCSLLLEKRGIDILLDTFIDKMPSIVQKDGRVHARFNTCGAATGRFSSNDPNLQNIPSHSKEIRGIFKARKGYSIVGGDFGAQEPRSLASMSHDNEMINAYKEGKDLYAVIASKVFHNKYENNLEFNPITGALQPEGKERRSKAKTLFLGILYGMGASTLAERTGVSLDEANKIINDFYDGFKGVKRFTEESQEMLKRLGYVTNAFGRRRHIADAMLPEYSISATNDKYEFNPLLGTHTHVDSKTEDLISRYRSMLEKARWKKDRDDIISKAKKDGLNVVYNGGFINRAMRQCLNARIQGTAASMTKLAMIMINNDPELKRLGFKLLITVHDEVLGECPRENSSECAKRLSELMVNAGKVKCANVPWKVDCYEVSRWYLDEFSAEVLKDFRKVNDLDKIKMKYPYIKPEYLEMMCNDSFDCNAFEDI